MGIIVAATVTVGR